jgi:DNA (cytosine-5)-methyltransferase 1
VDISSSVGRVYQELTTGTFIQKDIGKSLIHGDWDILIGGPPCKPWSPVNQSRRTEGHRDYRLVGRFIDHIKYLMPRIFIIENVPALGSDSGFMGHLDSLRKLGYSVHPTIVKYSDYGAAISRRRLFVVGLLNGSADNFIEEIKKDKRPSQSVRNAIEQFRHLERGKLIDHEWPNLKTIHKYAEKYKTGKYGWKILNWDLPAPSFGNVMKTYILPPEADPFDPSVRVLSILEVSRIMGFNHGFTFPAEMHIGERYQMLVDSVSPVFSKVLAEHVLKHINQYRF